MTKTIHPVILCGGSGTRLWPLSTPEHPKQFRALVSQNTMIVETSKRFETPLHTDLDFTQPLVVGAARHAELLRAQLPEVRKILEPFGRNSAPAVAAACLAHKADDLILILPADHDIQNLSAFHNAIAIAADAARDGAIVTFGIQPTHPATGYGYIKAATAAPSAGALPVEEFVEKPDLKTAKEYLASGEYYWNAGIFLFSVRHMLEALEAYAPKVLAGVRAALPQSDETELTLDRIAFDATPNISIDHAVMESAKTIKTVPVSMGWSDVGSYRALHELLSQSDDDNVTSGPVHLENSSGTYVRSEGPTIAINGVSDLVVVANGNEVMITPADDDVAVKSLRETVQKEGAALGLSPELRTRAKDWLWTAFETWSKVGWDTDHSGFVEQLHMDGTPDRAANRRVRVQARQVFSFAKAIELGWPESDTATVLVQNGLTYIDQRLRHREGGFVHLVNPDGSVVDARRNLYDHAFIILAGSAAYQALGSALGLKIANDAIAYIDAQLKDHEHGGWFESSEFELPRRSNPHMHMLEAMLALYEATGDPGALARAAECVLLFESKFFVPGADVLAEVFTADWQVSGEAGEIIYEPGHQYEWANLLASYQAIASHDTLSWRRRLVRRTDSQGLNPDTGFALNAVHVDGELANSKSRLWPQLERIRSYLLHHDLTSRCECEHTLLAVFETYLEDGPVGGWVDEIDYSARAKSSHIPSSMLYHLVTAFAPILNKN